MTPAAAIGWLLVLAGAIAVIPEIFTPRPVPGVVACGLALAIFGGVLIADYHEPKEGRDVGHD